MKRALAVLVGLALALISTMAVAAWLSSADGTGLVTAATVNQGHAPTATRGAGTVTLTWTASTMSGGAAVGGYTVLRHAGAVTTTACTTTSPTLTCNDPAPLGGAVTYGVVPTIGSHWAGSESTTTSFTYDVVAPNTTASVSPLANGAGWNNTTVTVTLNATDPAISSGVDHITYTVDAGSPVTATGASTSFPITGTGTHTVTFFAVDKAGNTETTESTTVKVDPDAPLITNLKPVTGASGSWSTIDCSNGDRVCADVTDSTSGMSGGTVTFSLTGTSGTNAGKCWNGSAFVAPTCAQQPMSVLSGAQYAGSAALTTALMGAGSYTMVVTATDVAGNTNTATSTFTVKTDQTVSFSSTAPANATVGGATYTVTATATSGLAVSFSSATTAVCTVSGSTVTFVGTGTCTINADQAGNATFNAAPQVQQSFAVKANQTITFTSTAPTNATVGGATYTPTATATSGLAVVLTIDASTSSVCTISSGAVSFNAVGTCKIDANQSGNGTFNAAPQVQQSVSVAAAPDTTPPVIGTVRPANSLTAGAWLTIACQVAGTTGKPCVSVTDNVGVTSVTMTLTKSNGRCWDGLTGSNFTGTGCPVTIATTLVSGVWVPTNTLAHANGSAGANFTDDTYTLVIKAFDAAGNSTTSTTSFRING